jgi:hypothetical protein
MQEINPGLESKFYFKEKIVKGTNKYRSVESLKEMA